MVHLDLDPNFFQDNERTVGKHLSSHLRLFWVMKWMKYLSRDIDDPWILQSDWGRSTTDHTQPKVVVSNAALTSWLSPCKKSMISLNCFLIHWWWKNTAIGLKKKHDWPHRTLSGSTRCYLNLMTISMLNVFEIAGFFPEILMISNLIGQET